MSETPVILADDEIYSQRVRLRESELEDAIIEHSKNVFGERAFYFPIKQKVESATRERATDGLLLDFSVSESPRFWLVEVELSTHDMMRTVGPQIKNFLSALKNEETLRKVRDTLYEEIRRNRSIHETVRSVMGAKEDLHFFLDRLLHNEEARGVLIVIDEYVDELEELTSEWFTGQQVEVILLKIYARNDKKIYYFTPHSFAKESRKKEKKYPETHVSWKAAYESVPDDIKKLADELIQRVAEKFVDAEHGPALTRSWYRFLVKNVKNRKKATFLVFWLTRGHLHLRLGADPRSFQDQKHLTKTYKGFFWARLPKTQEVGFNVSSKDELDYALTLVRQSYERSKRSSS